MAQYVIPQKTQREDKIVGPLTATNLIATMVAVGGGFVLFQMWNYNPIFWFNFIERIALTIPFSGFALAFGFLEINGRSFNVYFTALIHFLSTPKVRIWQKEQVELQPYNTEELMKQLEEAQENEPMYAKEAVSRNKIAELSQMLDRPGAAAQAAAAPKPSNDTLNLLRALDQPTGTTSNTVTPTAGLQQAPIKKKGGLIHFIITLITLPFWLPIWLLTLPFKILFYPFRRKKKYVPRQPSTLPVEAATPTYLQNVPETPSIAQNVVSSSEYHLSETGAQATPSSSSQAVSPDDLLKQLQEMKNQ